MSKLGEQEIITNGRSMKIDVVEIWDKGLVLRNHNSFSLKRDQFVELFEGDQITNIRQLKSGSMLFRKGRSEYITMHGILLGPDTPEAREKLERMVEIDKQKAILQTERNKIDRTLERFSYEKIKL
jgi:hypothetical protein